ncbi:signal peptidase I [Lutispora saccharofermentans]|uniref:Signal peptidase I n=1 Tax=Lutispora saccharofermentans TaxID=3024236 RepID=A0ABT1NBJ7_9FIRM|nr:signal peptidase I [Lutispora saccharofermentans]MCQ1528643.1 signal peptidase I [Lutispora saccharofermentans]
MIKKYIKIFFDVICAALVLCLALFIFSSFKAKSDPKHVPGIGSLKFMYVLTGSMSPAIKPGDMIITKTVKMEELDKGDIITFRASGNTLVTHRITDKNPDGSFVTKGDANNVADLDLKANSENIVGKYVFKIPKGGYVTKFIQTPIGMVLFILIPVGVLAGGEIKNFLKEMDEEEKRKKEEKAEDIRG